MNNSNRTDRWIKAWLCAAVLLPFALGAKVSQEFKEACRDGALARICFTIVDDVGSPVPDARVNVFFDMMDRSQGRRVIGTTDTNGICVAEAKTGGTLEIEVSRKGYYDTRTELCFIVMGQEHEVRDGKWQPWNMVKKLRLLPIRNPVAKVTSSPVWKTTTEYNKWVGFDLVMYDFVEPYGKGRIADMDVMFEWDGRLGKKYNGMALKVRFNGEYSGGYYADRFLESGIKGIYKADVQQSYQKEFAFSETVVRNKRGWAEHLQRQLFDPTKVLVCRSRCVLNEDGTLKSALYFQIVFLQFACDSEGTSIKFLSVYNPTPNDTNLEAKQ